MKFRPWVEHTLCIITSVLFLGLVMLDDFKLSAIPFILGVLGIVLLNLHVLKRWGRGLWFEKEDTDENN